MKATCINCGFSAGEFGKFIPINHQAPERIKYLSGDAETRRLAFVRERALHDEISELRAEREKGKLEGKLEIAGNLKALGVADEIIMRTTGLSRAEIEEL